MRGMAIPQETTMASSRALGPVMSIPPKMHIRVPFTAVHAWAHLLPEMQSTASTCRAHTCIPQGTKVQNHGQKRAPCLSRVLGPLLAVGEMCRSRSLLHRGFWAPVLGLGRNLGKSAAHVTCWESALRVTSSSETPPPWPSSLSTRPPNTIICPTCA